MNDWLKEMAVKQRKERERKARRRLILQAALHVFSQKGYNRATMDQVAKNAELAKGTSYYYFGGKEEILLELLEENTGKFFHQLFLEVRAETKFIEMVRRMLLSYAAYFSENKTFFKIYFQYQRDQIQLSAEKSLEFKKKHDEFRRPLENLLFLKMEEEQIPHISPRNFWRILRGIILSIDLEIHKNTPLEEINQMIEELIVVHKKGLQ